MKKIINSFLHLAIKQSEPVCCGCGKKLVAGAYPKWICLHDECKEYLKPQ